MSTPFAAERNNLSLTLLGWGLILMRSASWNAPLKTHRRPGGNLLLEWGGYYFIIVPPRRASRLTRWLRGLPLRLARARLALTPWRVYVAFYGYCCDTGPYTWAYQYRWGWEAWRSTGGDALAQASDGETGYAVVDRATYEDINDDGQRGRLGWDDQLRERQAEDDERWYGGLQ